MSLSVPTSEVSTQRELSKCPDECILCNIFCIGLVLQIGQSHDDVIVNNAHKLDEIAVQIRLRAHVFNQVTDVGEIPRQEMTYFPGISEWRKK
jgi:hypothetical protein